MVKYNLTCIGWVRFGVRGGGGGGGGGGSSVNTSGPRVQGWNFNGVLYHDALRLLNNESLQKGKEKKIFTK